MEDWTPLARLGKRLRAIQHEIEGDAAADAKRDSALRAIMIEGFDTLESYARFVVAHVRIFEAVQAIEPPAPPTTVTTTITAVRARRQ